MASRWTTVPVFFTILSTTGLLHVSKGADVPACSPESLGLDPATTGAYDFLPSTCHIQMGLGVSNRTCDTPQPPAPANLHAEVAALAHNASRIAKGGTHEAGALLAEAAAVAHDVVSYQIKGVPPVIVPNTTCRPTPAPFFAYNFVRNGSSPGEYIVVPPPRVPPGAAAGRKLAEATAVAAVPLDSALYLGDTAYYVPAANGTIDAATLYNDFYAAYNTQGVVRFQFPYGTWTVVNPMFGFHLLFSCNGVSHAPFTIDFGGASFVFSDGTQGGVFFSYCNNITATNGTFYYPFSVNPWYQATVANISADALTWTIQVQDGYPTYYVAKPYQALCVAWDPVTRLLKRNTSDIYPRPGYTTQLTNTTFQFSFSTPVSNVGAGDYITCRGNMGNHAVITWYNQYSTFSYLTVYNAAVFAFYEETGRANAYIGNTIAPYPYPVGLGGPQQAPLQSSTADGFHSSCSFVGPTLVNNRFSNMGDDGIAIHGRYYLVVGADQAASNITIALGCTYNCARLYPGNSLLAASNTTEVLGSVTMLAVTLIPNPLPAGTVSYSMPQVDLSQSLYANITVDCWPESFAQLGFDYTVTSPDNNGDGAVVVNNTVAYNRGRGLLLKASNVLVDGNAFIQNKFFSAQITPEFFFQEAYFTSNLTFRNNLLTSFYGGLIVGFISDGTGLPGTYQNHVNITIANNIIQNAADQPLLITSSTNVVVANNTFDHVLCYPFAVGAPYSFVPTPQPPAFVAFSSNLLFSGNAFGGNTPNCSYGNYAPPIQTYGATVTNLTIQ